MKYYAKVYTGDPVTGVIAPGEELTDKQVSKLGEEKIIELCARGVLGQIAEKGDETPAKAPVKDPEEKAAEVPKEETEEEPEEETEEDSEEETEEESEEETEEDSEEETEEELPELGEEEELVSEPEPEPEKPAKKKTTRGRK